MGALDREAHWFDRLHAAVSGLAQPAGYPPACSLALVLQDALSLDATLLSKLKAKSIGTDKAERVALVRKFLADPRAARATAIAVFVAAELDRWKQFFDTIESKPLTAEPRLSVVVDLQNLDIRAGTIHPKPDPPDAGTKHLAMQTGPRSISIHGGSSASITRKMLQLQRADGFAFLAAPCFAAKEPANVI